MLKSNFDTFWGKNEIDWKIDKIRLFNLIISWTFWLMKGRGGRIKILDDFLKFQWNNKLYG